ncbi:hypothetical protein [uncultured Duncaniella sp.]|jgi:hypothetical protein|uniref:hypothetical protein n=1 Tax=uncultured Duncaniella sp. TaxID=2768039 RepID=UPI0025AF9AA1|nr:hypothetical protein [uncultured Duncaniella sp.]
MKDVQQVTEIARGISEYGAMAIMTAVYILLSAAVMVAIFKWFRTIINQILSDNKDALGDLLSETREQNNMLRTISEGLRVETKLRIRNLSGFAFDLSVERVCRLIKNVREENHIADREKTGKKIRNLLHNLYEDRNTKFDTFTYKGKPLGQYCNPEWIERVAQVVEGEIYNEHGVDNKRAFTNVKMVYDDIKLEFYHRMND